MYLPHEMIIHEDNLRSPGQLHINRKLSANSNICENVQNNPAMYVSILDAKKLEVSCVAFGLSLTIGPANPMAFIF